MRSVLIGLLVFIPSSQADEKAERQTPKEQYEALLKEFEAAVQELQGASNKPGSKEEQKETLESVQGAKERSRSPCVRNGPGRTSGTCSHRCPRLGREIEGIPHDRGGHGDPRPRPFRE